MMTAHDHEILSYDVDLKNKVILIHTKYEELFEKKRDIIFYDVLAHYFENGLTGSIICEFRKFDLTIFIKDNEELLKKRKSSCWPLWYKTVEELENKLTEEQYQYYTISPSYGLGGWILAKGYEVRELG